MRITEIMSDFRGLQYYIAQIQANPPPEDYYLEGYTLLRSVIAEAQAVLASPYSYGTGTHPQGDPEAEKTQLIAYVVNPPFYAALAFLPFSFLNTIRSPPDEHRRIGPQSKTPSRKHLVVHSC